MCLCAVLNRNEITNKLVSGKSVFRLNLFYAKNVEEVSV